MGLYDELSNGAYRMYPTDFSLGGVDDRIPRDGGQAGPDRLD